MSENNGHNVVFKRNLNPLISFLILGWNTINLLSRKKTGAAMVIAVLLFLILLPIINEFLNGVHVQFVLLLYSFAAITSYFFYVGWLFFSPIYSVRRLEFFDEKGGFELLRKDGQKIFMPYQNIISIRNECHYTYNPYFSILFKNSKGTEEKILLPLDITKIYDALDRIVHHIPKEKWGDVKVVDGKVTSTPIGPIS
ncbi:MAG: hypothetical protein Q8P56_06340 [Candidatus Uhrbacteria bacterium]|nr:hypothetical protein [Candidatus Uhrbacteria bacterium]